MSSKRPRYTTGSAPTYNRQRHRLSPADMLDLLNKFPSTRDLIKHWDADLLDEKGRDIWADLSSNLDPIYLPLTEDEEYWEYPSLPDSMMTLATIRFVLSIWDEHKKWQSGKSTLTRTLLDIWDTQHRDTFLNWAQDPKAP